MLRRTAHRNDLTLASALGPLANAAPGQIDSRALKVIAHPLRHRILSELTTRVASPRELADDLGETVSKVAYHVRLLRDMGMIELVREERRRGAVEHYYRGVVRPVFDDAAFSQLPVDARRSITADTLRRVISEATAAFSAGLLDDPAIHVSRIRLALDDDGMEEVGALLVGVLERALEISAECIARQAAGGRDAPPQITTELALMHFPRAAG